MRVNISSPQHLSPRLFSSMNVAFCATCGNKHSNLQSGGNCFCDLVRFVHHQIERKHNKHALFKTAMDSRALRIATSGLLCSCQNKSLF